MVFEVDYAKAFWNSRFVATTYAFRTVVCQCCMSSAVAVLAVAHVFV